MIPLKYGLILSLCVLPSITTAQQGSLLMSGQVRHRTEWKDKDISDSTKVGGSSLLRTRLNLVFRTAASDAQDSKVKAK